MRRAVCGLALMLAGCSPPAPETTDARGAPALPRITQFYADRAEAGPGESVVLCYGVENAKEVRLTPAVAELSPSFNRCIEVIPEATTEYTLTASGENGREATATLTIRRVARATRKRESASAPEIATNGGVQVLEFTAKPSQVAAGGAATLCYAVQGASSVRVQPSAVQLGAVQRGCFYVNPERTTTYTLTAEGAGSTATRQVTVTVR
jgi:hypothetical protein